MGPLAAKRESRGGIVIGVRPRLKLQPPTIDGLTYDHRRRRGRVIAAVLAQHDEDNGRGLDALYAMRQAELATRALEHAGYDIRKRR
jgi:hypothetical protein